MKIYMARHGQTQPNVEDNVCGRTDVPLTETGLQQAEKLADNAAGKDIDLIVVSPMIRARQTAQAVANRYNIPVVIDDRLIEQSAGIYEGKSRTNPDYLTNKRKFCYKYPGGESMMQVAQRVYNRIDDIRRNYSDKNVLVVCHGGVCRVARTYFVDMENEEFSTYTPDNATITEYEIDGLN